MEIVIFIVVGVLAGLMGAMVGLGGGVLIVPVLSLFMGVPIHQAIAASAVAIVATSTTGAISYVRQGLANMRLGMTMETMTTLGAILGGITAALLSREILSGVFAALLVVMSVYLYLKRRLGAAISEASDDLGLLGESFYDPYLKQDVRYRVKRPFLGLVASLVAGNLSGLLGIGGGVIQVPTMTVGMGMPMKAAVATSNFMIGVTACAGAIVHYAGGRVNPAVAVPIALGVTLGARIGSRVAPKVSGVSLTVIFSIVMLVFAVQMGLSAFGIRVR